MHGVAEDNTAMYDWSPIEISVVVRSIEAVRDERPGGGDGETLYSNSIEYGENGGTP